MLPTTTPTESDPLKCQDIAARARNRHQKFALESWKELSPSAVIPVTVKEVYKIEWTLFSPSIGTDLPSYIVGIR